MKSIHFLLITMLMHAEKDAIAQQQQPEQLFIPKVIPPTPNVSRIMKFGYISINY